MKRMGLSRTFIYHAIHSNGRQGVGRFVTTILQRASFVSGGEVFVGGFGGFGRFASGYPELWMASVHGDRDLHCVSQSL